MYHTDCTDCTPCLKQILDGVYSFLHQADLNGNNNRWTIFKSTKSWLEVIVKILSGYKTRQNDDQWTHMYQKWQKFSKTPKKEEQAHFEKVKIATKLHKTYTIGTINNSIFSFNFAIVAEPQLFFSSFWTCHMQNKALKLLANFLKKFLLILEITVNSVSLYSQSIKLRPYNAMAPEPWSVLLYQFLYFLKLK